MERTSRSGTWFSYGQTRLGQGRENARQFLKDNPDMCKEIRTRVLDAKLPKPESAEARPAAKGTRSEKPAAAARAGATARAARKH